MQESIMPFREKKAWVTIFSLLTVFVPYYYLMMSTYHSPEPDFEVLPYMALFALITFIVLEVVLVVVARMLSPEDAGMPRDERDQLFAFRAARIAHVALIVLMILVTFPLTHTYGGNWGWGMLYLAAIIVSEILRAAMLIVQYRRGY